MRHQVWLAVLVWLLAAPASAQWVRVDSPNFTIFGEIGEKRTREYGAEFERFREALGRVVPGAALRAAVPAVVIIFKDQRSFAPYRPTFNGKPVELSGYFSGGSSLNTIMLPATDKDAALRTIFHEYSHLVIANVARGLPPWLGEGLAEYYSTFEVRPDGRRATLGRPIEAHLIRLNTERLLTLEELLAVSHDSPLYNEGSRRSMFYAQSWALVHMLLNGEPRRDKAFNEYVRLVSAGRSAVDAWTEVFADPKIMEQLRRYVRQFSMTGYAFTFDEDIAPATFAVTTPPNADVLAALGDLRRHVPGEPAAAHINGIPGPPSAYVKAIKGLVHVDDGDHEAALPLLIEAAGSTTDWLVRYRAATGLERITNGAGRTETGHKAAAAALEALNAVIQARPDLPHALALKALVLGPGDDGLAALKRARELAPGYEHYAIWEAQFHLDRGEFADARRILAPLMSPLFPKDIRDYARSVMGSVVTVEQEATQRAKPANLSPPANEPPTHGGQVQWVFRMLQPGELRIEGVLERIECPRVGITLHVRQGDRAMRFIADTFDAIEFLTYRDDLGGRIQCGPRKPADPVYVTYVTDPRGSDGRIIAVEFLPKR
jgi:hypothetical protein